MYSIPILLTEVALGGVSGMYIKSFFNVTTLSNLCWASGKFVLTKFCRALIYVNKISQQSSRSVWENVPQLDFSEKWWNKSISEIDEELFNKYNVPQNIREFVKKNIQTKTIANIINYK